MTAGRREVTSSEGVLQGDFHMHYQKNPLADCCHRGARSDASAAHVSMQQQALHCTEPCFRYVGAAAPVCMLPVEASCAGTR
jgi:hypothetical protein